MTPIRWSDRDRYFGPFTFATPGRSEYRPTGIELSSGDGDDYAGCRLKLQLLGFTLIIALPAFLLRPARRWVDTSHYGWSQGGRGYWNLIERAYGFSLGMGALQIRYGRVTNDSSTEQQWYWSLPWKDWRHVRFSLYGLEGEEVWTQLDRHKRKGPGSYDAQHAAEEACPSVTFRFIDFDGEELTARTIIEERQWKRGVRGWRWLSLIWPDKVRRSLAITFSGETGTRKGSWKGGTIGCGIDLEPGELHVDGFRRHCAATSKTLIEGSAVPDHGKRLRDDLPKPTATKEPGWNDGVKHWFHVLPQRATITPTFSDAFHEAAAEGPVPVERSFHPHNTPDNYVQRGAPPKE